MTLPTLPLGRAALLLVSCLASVGALPAAQAAPAADELAGKVQARYDRVTDFEGQFTQTYEGGVLRTRTHRARYGGHQAPGPHALGLHQPGTQGVRLERR